MSFVENVRLGAFHFRIGSLYGGGPPVGRSSLSSAAVNDSPTGPRPVSVLVVDDSAFMRTALTRMIDSDPALRVTGTAQNGMQALEKIIELQPDVVTLDVEMPRLNGIETLKRIMEDFPRPVIMVSSLTKAGAESTLEAL